MTPEEREHADDLDQMQDRLVERQDTIDRLVAELEALSAKYKQTQTYIEAQIKRLAPAIPRRMWSGMNEQDHPLLDIAVDHVLAEHEALSAKYEILRTTAQDIYDRWKADPDNEYLADYAAHHLFAALKDQA